MESSKWPVRRLLFYLEVAGAKLTSALLFNILAVLWCSPSSPDYLHLQVSHVKLSCKISSKLPSITSVNKFAGHLSKSVGVSFLRSFSTFGANRDVKWLILSFVEKMQIVKSMLIAHRWWHWTYLEGLFRGEFTGNIFPIKGRRKKWYNVVLRASI